MQEIIGEFETHFTLEPPPNGSEGLREIAERIGLKWLWIELARGETPSQPMFTATSAGKLSEIIRQSHDLGELLVLAGQKVVRVKIEAAPTSAGIPVSADEAAHEPRRYFEHHIKLQLPANADLGPMAAIAMQHGAHLSRNARRQRDDGFCERFVTQRCHGLGQTEARAALAELLDDLRAAGLHVLDSEEEYVVYDSNLDLDAGWLP